MKIDRPAKRLIERYGPWALVTGASDGIGRAFAVELAKQKIGVILVARRREKLESLSTELHEQYHVPTRIVVADLSTPSGLTGLLEEIHECDIGLLVASAGFGTSGPFIDSTLASELEMIDLNCRAVAHLAHVYGQRLARRGKGGLVLMSSLVAFQGVPNAANYAATKAYVQTLAEGLAHELHPAGVDVLAVAPGPVRSGFGARANMKMSVAQTPEEVASNALAALGRTSLVRPGVLAKALEWSLLPLPRLARVQIMARVMRGMTAHQ